MDPPLKAKGFESSKSAWRSSSRGASPCQSRLSRGDSHKRRQRTAAGIPGVPQSEQTRPFEYVDAEAAEGELPSATSSSS